MIDDRQRDAKRAYASLDIEASKKVHTDRDTKTSLEEPTIHDIEKVRYIGDMLYGGIDGIVTTF